MKRCENCIWFEQCGCDCACELYESYDDSHDIEEYSDDLYERACLYIEQIDEQNN